jgi:hypothetical protein
LDRDAIAGQHESNYLECRHVRRETSNRCVSAVLGIDRIKLVLRTETDITEFLFPFVPFLKMEALLLSHSPNFAINDFHLFYKKI